MTKRNERTSARGARIAGRVLAAKHFGWQEVYVYAGSGEFQDLKIKWSDIRALAASALTQTADRPKRDTPQDIIKRAYVRLTPKPRRRARRK